MLIKSIWAKNFRNYRKLGSQDNPISFSTDSINVIYGRSGFGKTTLLQLFRWILYGSLPLNIGFDDNSLPNIDEINATTEGNQICVEGCISFIHDDKQYRVIRCWHYLKKNDGGVRHLSADDELRIYRQNDDDKGEKPLPYDVRGLERAITEILPKSLAAYFFFDGEKFADNWVNTKKDLNAEGLSVAVSVLFRTNVYKTAIDILGTKTTKWTVLGQINHDLEGYNFEKDDEIKSEKSNLTWGLSIQKSYFKNYQEKLEILNHEIAELEKEIGDMPNLKELNIVLKNLESEKEKKEKQHESGTINLSISFGQALLTYMVKLDVVQANRLKPDTVEKFDLPEGLSGPILRELISKHKCICGHEIGKKEEELFSEYIRALPPNSYRTAYESFLSNAQGSLNITRSQLIPNLLDQAKILYQDLDEISDLNIKIQHQESQIRKFGGKNVDNLYEEKTEKIRARDDVIRKISQCEKLINFYEKKLRDIETKWLEQLKQQKIAEQSRIAAEIAENVAENLERFADSRIENVRRNIEHEIERLLNSMLTGSRKEVRLDSDFHLTVREQGITYTTRGQAAVASYSYVLGLLKVLTECSNDETEDDIKVISEYPLVIDAPFSETDAEQEERALQHFQSIPKQVIILSNRNLNSALEGINIGKVYAIKGESQKARLEEISFSDADAFFAEGGEK